MKKSWIIIGLLVVILIVGVAIILTQTPPTITKTAEVTLTIQPSPDFTLTTSIEHIDTFPNRVVSFAATVTSVNNFAGEIVFTLEGLPPGITVAYFPSSIVTLGPDEPKGVQIDLGIPDDQSLVGNYAITVTAESTQYN